MGPSRLSHDKENSYASPRGHLCTWQCDRVLKGIGEGMAYMLKKGIVTVALALGVLGVGSSAQAVPIYGTLNFFGFLTLDTANVNTANAITGYVPSPPAFLAPTIVGGSYEFAGIAVGTPVARRPPHRSERAELVHSALALGAEAESHTGIGVSDADER